VFVEARMIGKEESQSESENKVLQCFSSLLQLNNVRYSEN
jgi:hypothetical protein